MISCITGQWSSWAYHPVMDLIEFHPIHHIKFLINYNLEGGSFNITQ
jgi:hypothetical protein